MNHKNSYRVNLLRDDFVRLSGIFKVYEKNLLFYRKEVIVSLRTDILFEFNYLVQDC